MKNFLSIVLLALVAMPFVSQAQKNRNLAVNPQPPQPAQVDYFLKLDGVEGETNTPGCQGCIQIESWSFGASNAGSMAAGSGGGAGKASFSDLSFMVSNGKASPQLMQACATGQHIKSAKLVCRKAGKEQQEYLTYELSDCLVSSFSASQTGMSSGGDRPSESVSMSSGGDRPSESLSLNFTKIEFRWTDDAGNVRPIPANQNPQSVRNKFMKK